VEIGEIVRHRRTGFTGIVTSRVENEDGGIRFGGSILRCAPRVVNGSRRLVILPSRDYEEIFGFDEEELEARE
jgi:hypothetical protein